MNLAFREIQEFLRSRRSVRRFLPEPVPGEVLQMILETAIQSPSAHNRQPWRFAVLVNDDVKTRLAEAMGSNFRQDLLRDGLKLSTVEATVQRSRQRILAAPACVLVCVDYTDMDSYPDEKRQAAERLMAVQSTAMAGATLLFAAHAAGLGAVWICAPLFTPQTVTQVLNLPKAWEAQGLILLGYPQEIPDARPRKLLKDVTRYY